MTDLSSASWPNTTTRMVFEMLMLKECDSSDAQFTKHGKWYQIAFEQTDFASFTPTRLQEELEEFYDFAVEDFLEILTAARNNPINTETTHLAMTNELMAQVLTEKRSEIDFGFIVELINNN